MNIFLIDLGRSGHASFVDFASELEGRGILNVDNYFLHFSYFGQLANKRPYDRFFGQLVLHLEASIHQDPTKEVHKIDQQELWHHDASWLGIWISLGTTLGGSWRQVGRQVVPKSPPKSEKNRGLESVVKNYPNWLQLTPGSD